MQRLFLRSLTSSTGSNNCNPAKIPDGTAGALVDLGGGVTTTAGYSFKWFAGNSVASPAVPNLPNNGNQPTAIQLQGTNPFTVQVTNSTTLCVNAATVSVVDVSAKPVITLVPADNTVCDKTLVTIGPQQFDGRVTITSVIYKGVPYAGPSTLSISVV